MSFHFNVDEARENALPVVRVASDLAVPVTPVGIQRAQGYDLRPGDVYQIYAEDRIAYARCEVQGTDDAGGGQPIIRFVITDTNTAVYLTDWQISYLESQGRIRPVRLADGDRGVFPGRAHSLTLKELASAQRSLGYVKAILEACDGGNLTHGPIMAAATRYAEATRDDKRPCHNTLVAWLDKYLDRGWFDPLVALAPLRKVSAVESKWGSFIQFMLGDAAEDAWADKQGTWETAKFSFIRKLAKANRALALEWYPFLEAIDLDGGEGIDLEKLAGIATAQAGGPSDRTFQRRVKAVDKFTRDLLRFGIDKARERHRTYLRQHLPHLPLEIVDVDHHTLDVLCIDDEKPVAFGRPDLIVFRDRATGSVLGYAISFEFPSYEQFLRGFRHAMYPKDMVSHRTLVWSQYGRPMKLGVDNALHFLGNSITQAGRELGFSRVEWRPGQPYMKGALERLFGVLGKALVHRLPGTTQNSPEERDKYEEELPVLTLAELDWFLTYWFAMYNMSAHEGVGMLRTLSGVPELLWAERIGTVHNRKPLDVEIFTRLAGDVEHRTIQKIGIEWDYVTYNSPELIRFRIDPRHKDGSGPHNGTKYRVTRDPSDIGHIWVTSPFSGEAIRVPACDADMGYACGLPLKIHRALVAYHRQNHGTPRKLAQVMAVKYEFEERLAALTERRQKSNTARKLAAFMDSIRTMTRRSATVEVVANPKIPSGSPLLITATPPAVVREKRSSRAAVSEIRESTGSGEAVRVPDVATDLIPLESGSVEDGYLVVPAEPWGTVPISTPMPADDPKPIQPGKDDLPDHLEDWSDL